MSGIEETALKSQLAGLLALLAAVIRLSFFPSTVTVLSALQRKNIGMGVNAGTAVPAPLS